MSEARSKRVDLRMTPAAKRTLQQAAAATGKTVTEFLLDSGLSSAYDALADRRRFALNAKDWARFMKALDNPPRSNPALRKLLARKPAWER
jgi:uncharacterized protein (DUF1778 family)